MTQRRHQPKNQSLYGRIKASTIQYWINNSLNIAWTKYYFISMNFC